MQKVTVEVNKFCKKFQIDFNNIYLRPSSTLTHCYCPSPPKYLESIPLDKEYIGNTRYISENDKIKYGEYVNKISNDEYFVYDYSPKENIDTKIYIEEPMEDTKTFVSDEDSEDGEDDFEIFLK